MMTKDDAGGSTWADPDDAPELTDEFFEQADIYEGNKLIRRGRPPTGKAKHLLSLRVDQDTVEAMRAFGPGWQSRANNLLGMEVGPAKYAVEVYQPSGIAAEIHAEFDDFRQAVEWLDGRLAEDGTRLPRLFTRERVSRTQHDELAHRRMEQGNGKPA